MKKFLQNISIAVMSILVVVLSMGFSISKMACDKGGSIFFGKEVPNCMQQDKPICVMDFQEISCCTKEKIVESCCPQTQDDTCEGDSRDIKFDFETIFSNCNFTFSFFKFPVCFLVLENTYVLSGMSHYYNAHPPPKFQFVKLYLSKIQSFLL